MKNILLLTFGLAAWPVLANEPARPPRCAMPEPPEKVIFGYCVYDEDGEPIRFVGDIITNDMGNLICGWTSCKFFNPANWPEGERAAWRQKALDSGMHFMTIYARDWEDVEPYKKLWGSRYLGNNIGEYASYLYQPRTSYPKGVPCGENLLQARDRFVTQHIAKVAAAWKRKCPFVFSTCGSALACHEQDGGLDFVCNEIYAVGAGNLAYATAECRGSARKYGPEWWSSWYAHDWYTKETPYYTDQKFDLLTVSLKQSYLMGTSLMVLESGTQANQAWHYTPQSATNRAAMAAIERYDDPIPTRYRRTMKAFWDWLKAHPRAKGSPRTDIAIAMGNLDAYVGCFYPDWPVWSQYDALATNALYRYGAPEKTWCIAQNVFFPKPKDAVKPFPNDHLAASPYGQVDVMQIDEKSRPEELARYRLIVYAGWNTMTPKIRATLLGWVKDGGTLVLCRPHLSTRIDRDYVNYADKDLLDLGFPIPAAGQPDDVVEKSLGRGKVCLFTARQFPSADEKLAAAYEALIRREAARTLHGCYLKPAEDAKDDFNYFAYAVYGEIVYILNLDLVSPRRVTLVTPDGERTLDFAPCELKTEKIGEAAGPTIKAGFVRPDLSYVDSGEELPENPARGAAPGGWVTFKPEGLPNWHGQGGFHSSLWELSRFSGGREQGGKRPPAERVGGKDIPITDAMKADVRRFLAETREKHGALIVRLGYTWSDSAGCEPSDFDILLGHIRDLSRIMAGFPDVIAGVEAGIAGPWGEMHTSDYCAKEPMVRILKTYLENLKPSTPLLVRAPRYLEYMDFDMRLGMYNDGYLGTWWDYGTWAGAFTRERGCEILKARSRVPYGGEMAYVSREFLDKNSHRCRDLWDPAKWNIVRDWYDVHLAYLRNLGEKGHTLATYLREVTFDSRKWAFDGMPDLREYDGRTMSEFVRDHMGYRFVVRDARVKSPLRADEKAAAALEIENTGFGSLLLPCQAEMLLSGSEAGMRLPIALDLASVAGGSRQRFPISFPLLKPLKKGAYDIQLRVTAGGAPLRFANAGMWDAERSAHRIGRLVVE